MKYVLALSVVAFLCFTYGTGLQSQIWGTPTQTVLRNAFINASRILGRHVSRNFTYVVVGVSR